MYNVCLLHDNNQSNSAVYTVGRLSLSVFSVPVVPRPLVILFLPAAQARVLVYKGGRKGMTKDIEQP